MLGKKLLVALAAMSIFNLSTADVNSDLNFMSVSKVYAAEDSAYSRAQKKCQEGDKLSYNGDYQGAIKKYTEAINMGSSYLKAYLERSSAYCKLQKYNEAIADLNKVIELVESNYKNDFPKGSESYNYMIKKAYAYTAMIHNYLKDEALKNLSAAIEKPDAESYVDVGSIYAVCKDYDKALEYYNKALKLNPNYEYAYRERGRAYYDLKKYNEAIADFSKGIEIAPKFGWLYYDRGKAYKAIGENKKAEADFAKAKELGYSRSEE